MNEKICYVVGAGENYGLDFQPVTGDFDTLKCIPGHPNTIVLSEEKDDTDTFAAVREGIKAGYTSFHIYCGTGRRIDHTMANLHVLAYLSANNMQGFLFDQDTGAVR